MRATLILAAAAALLATSLPSAHADSSYEIINDASYYWDQWTRYRSIPSGCYRQDWQKPNFYVCSSRRYANRYDTQQAFWELQRRYGNVRVNSRRNDWNVFNHNDVSDHADFWTIEYGYGCFQPGNDRLNEYCFLIAVQNDRRGWEESAPATTK